MCSGINERFSMETGKATRLPDVISGSLFKTNFMAVVNLLDQQPGEKSLQAPSLINKQQHQR